MKKSLYQERQEVAKARLVSLGQIKKARVWIKKNPPPKNWKGTPWEWAMEEMPLDVMGYISAWMGS